MVCDEGLPNTDQIEGRTGARRKQLPRIDTARQEAE
jgi:hypothetical protein